MFQPVEKTWFEVTTDTSPWAAKLRELYLRVFAGYDYYPDHDPNFIALKRLLTGTPVALIAVADTLLYLARRRLFAAKNGDTRYEQ